MFSLLVCFLSFCFCLFVFSVFSVYFLVLFHRGMHIRKGLIFLRNKCTKHKGPNVPDRIFIAQNAWILLIIHNRLSGKVEEV